MPPRFVITSDSQSTLRIHRGKVVGGKKVEIFTCSHLMFLLMGCLLFSLFSFRVYVIYFKGERMRGKAGDRIKLNNFSLLF